MQLSLLSDQEHDDVLVAHCFFNTYMKPFGKVTAASLFFCHVFHS